MKELLTPEVGEYFTDGARLVQLLGLNKDGEYLVEDAVSDETLTMPVDELGRPGVWRKVERNGDS